MTNPTTDLAARFEAKRDDYAKHAQFASDVGDENGKLIYIAWGSAFAQAAEMAGETTERIGTAVTLAHLHAANIARQAEWCPNQVPDLSFRGNELGGECGEAQNVIKKLERERLGWRGSRATLDDLAQELADVVICADLCAVTAGIDLGAAVVAKFNATSEKVGLTTKLAAPQARDMARAGAAGGADGFVLVPARPTPEMLGAFWRTKNTGTVEIGGEHQDSSDVAAYRAMIAAWQAQQEAAEGQK